LRPTVAVTLLPEAVAPIRLVSRPLVRLKLLPAVTVVSVLVVSVPLALPRAWLAAALMVKPFCAPPSEKPMPMLALDELLLLVCVAVFCAARRSRSFVALRLALLPALRFAPMAVRLPWPFHQCRWP
jgi:hypothetical protein